MDTAIQASPRLAQGIATKAHRHGPLRATAVAMLLVGIAQLGLAAGARAQDFLDDDILPPRAVAWRLADRGFTGIGRPRFDGRAYVVEAFGPGGARVRLVVDPEDGAILSRQRLDAPVIAVRPGPAAPGYGWTEEEARGVPGRGRFAERLVPPADIPLPESRGAYPPRMPVPTPDRARREAAPENPYGLNPEAGRAPAATRRVARVAPGPELRPAESRPALRDAPPAPRPSAARKPADVKSDAAKAPEPKPEEAKPAEVKAVEAKPALPKAAPSAPDWKDPPEGRRNVRVIGGATVVPGTADKDAPAAQ